MFTCCLERKQIRHESLCQQPYCLKAQLGNYGLTYRIAIIFLRPLNTFFNLMEEKARPGHFVIRWFATFMVSYLRYIRHNGVGGFMDVSWPYHGHLEHVHSVHI